MKEHTGFAKITKFLSNWLSDNGFECHVDVGPDFEYDSSQECLYYSPLVTENHEKWYTEFCKSLVPSIPDCGIFILSFFHELGHYKCDEAWLFDERDEEEYSTFLESVSVDSINDRDRYISYYKHPVELIATCWGCNYIINHKDEITYLQENLSKLFCEYFENNGIEKTN